MTRHSFGGLEVALVGGDGKFLTVDDGGDLSLGQPDDALVEHHLVEVAEVDRLGAGGADPGAVNSPLLRRLGTGIEVGGLLVAAESAARRKDRSRHGAPGHGRQRGTAPHCQWRGAVRLDLGGGNALGDGTQKPGHLGALSGRKPG